MSCQAALGIFIPEEMPSLKLEQKIILKKINQSICH